MDKEYLKHVVYFLLMFGGALFVGIKRYRKLKIQSEKTGAIFLAFAMLFSLSVLLLRRVDLLLLAYLLASIFYSISFLCFIKTASKWNKILYYIFLTLSMIVSIVIIYLRFFF
jgi:hypothetical protein